MLDILDMIFRIFGLIAVAGLLGAIIGIIATPFMLYLMELFAYALALIIVILLRRRKLKELPKLLKSFPKFTQEPVDASQASKASIHYPNPIHNSRESVINRDIIGVRRKQTAHTSDEADHHPSDNNVFDTVKQPTIKKVSDTTPNIFHRVILFYKSYYGYSTKVEKNQL